MLWLCSTWWSCECFRDHCRSVQSCGSIGWKTWAVRDGVAEDWCSYVVGDCVDNGYLLLWSKGSIGICFCCLPAFVHGLLSLILAFYPFIFSYAGSEEPCAYGELISIGGFNGKQVKISAAIMGTVQKHLGVDDGRFYLNFVGVEGSNFGWRSATFWYISHACS